METNEEMMDVLEPKTRGRKPKEDSTPDIAELLKTMQEMAAKIAALEGAGKTVDEPGNMLDIFKPYKEHRSEGGVAYEQGGKKFNGKKMLIEE